jgi:hypothetical protein
LSTLILNTFLILSEECISLLLKIALYSVAIFFLIYSICASIFVTSIILCA